MNVSSYRLAVVLEDGMMAVSASIFSGLSGFFGLLLFHPVRRFAKLVVAMSALVLPEGVRHQSPELGAVRVLWTIWAPVVGTTGLREPTVTLAAAAAGNSVAFVWLSA